MGAMKKIVLAVIAVVAVVILAAVGYVAHLASRLNSPEFQEEVRAAVSRQLGAEVRFEEMDIALLSGVTLRRFAVANPEPFDGDLFAAEAFVLKYKVWPLLSGRVEVEQLSLERPVLGLIMDEDARFNYRPWAGGRAPRRRRRRPPKRPPRPSRPGRRRQPFPRERRRARRWRSCCPRCR